MADESLSEFEEDDDFEYQSDYETGHEEDEDEDKEITKKVLKTSNSKDIDDFSEEELNFDGEEATAAAADDDDDAEFTSPEILIANLHRESRKYLDFSSLKLNKIKCVALCKILFGENHWKTAEAHIQLAEIYLKGKLYSQQTLKHINIARDILLFLQNRGNSAAVLEMQYLLQNLYLIMGKANLQLNKCKIAENCLQKAKLVSDNSKAATDKYLCIRMDILSALGNASSKIGKIGQGMEYIEEALEIVSKMSSQYKNMSVKLYKQMVELEILNGEHANFTLASEFAKKALDVSLEVNGHDCKDTAEIFTMISRVEALKEDSNYDKIEESIKEALDIYVSIEEPGKLIPIQKMHCKVLMQQEKFDGARAVLELAIIKCEEIYGDCSTQCADLFELMGSILFAQGKMTNALDYFSKAEEIYAEKKRCAKKQQKLIKIIDMIRKSSKDEKLKTSKDKLQERPRFM